MEACDLGGDRVRRGLEDPGGYDHERVVLQQPNLPGRRGGFQRLADFGGGDAKPADQIADLYGADAGPFDNRDHALVERSSLEGPQLRGNGGIRAAVPFRLAVEDLPAAE